MPVVTHRLEDHLVWPVRAAEAEAGGEVVAEVGLLLDSGQERLVDRLLVLNAVLRGLLLLSHLSVPCPYDGIRERTYLRLLALLEERILTRLVGGLVLGEVTVLADLVQNLAVDTLDINLGRGRDNVASVYPSQRNAIDFERTGDEENTLGKVLEEDDTLAAETTSEEDDDSTGLERGPGFRRAHSLASLESQLAELWWCSPHRSSIFVHCSCSSHVTDMHPPCQSSSSSRCILVVSRRSHTFLGTETSSAG